MDRFHYHYVRSLPSCIWAFITMAPLHKLPIIFASIHRMTYNGALLKTICEQQNAMDRHTTLMEADKFIAQQKQAIHDNHPHHPAIR